MATTPTSWMAWTSARSAMWSPSAATSPWPWSGGQRHSGPTRWSPPRGSDRGGRSTGVKAARAGWVGGSWRSAAGGGGRAGARGAGGRFVAVRCWRVRADGTRRIGWLIGEDSSDGKRRYFWSNFGPRTALEKMVEYAHRRHWVEQYHEEAKDLLGWDQYQGRLWSGFHRHAVSVMLAYSFLVWYEWQQRPERARPGRPRRAFSPSAGPASRVPAGGASPGLRLAPARSGQGVAVA